MASFLIPVISLELILISWVDIKTRKISNLWIVLNILIWFILLFNLPEIYIFKLSHFLFPLGFLVIGFILFNLKIMGAGDSKLLSSLFLVIPEKHHFMFFENVLYATLITGTIFMMIGIVKNWRNFKAFALSAYWKGMIEAIKSHFSYAPVITLAWLLLGVRV